MSSDRWGPEFFRAFLIIIAVAAPFLVIIAAAFAILANCGIGRPLG